MRIRPLKLFPSLCALACFFATHLLAAETDTIRHESISVEAPFTMPAIGVTVFPARTFVVTNFGAVEGGDISAAIRSAIAACHDAGGGSVVIPRGHWSTGQVHLQSNVNLHLDDGAVLSFSSDPADYLPAVQSSWEGLECFNYSPLIYAFGCTNVALTGHGTLEAKLDVWKQWMNRPPAHLAALKQLYTMTATNAPVEQRQLAVGENHLRPQFIQFNRCQHVLIEDVKIRNSPFWTLHLLLDADVVVRRVDISARNHNNDGIDPEMTRNLLIEDCKFDQGDDAIAIKAGTDRDGRRLNTPTENVVIRNCTMLRGHQLVAIGSEVSGGIRNVYVHDCKFINADADKPQNILFIKTNRRRGGFVENIFVENITARSTQFGVLGIDTDVLYEWRDLVPTYEEKLTVIHGIHVKNVTVEETGGTPFKITGDARLPIKDVYLENITVQKAHGQASSYTNAESIHESGLHIAELVDDGKAGK
ncbi:MAG TPA: glycoside hydrolase family 28 protein [Candidatus Acidoferrales bacterium]|nr:glycoside hydrolase family 28 protein [Candidatus Acidoferrales bacterium]